MSDRLRILKSIYGGDLSGNTLTLPTFGHPTRDRGTSVTDAPWAPDGLLVYVHNGSEQDALTAKEHYLRDLGEASAWSRRGRRGLDPIAEMRQREQRVHARAEMEREAEERRRRARAVWNAARDPRDTIVETYLRSRCLDLPERIAGGVIRFHPACPWETGTAPAMVCAMRDITSGEVVAAHRTALTPEGRKVGRKMLGPTRGTAIMLDPLGAISGTLAIGEGVESCLAARQLGVRPVWALGSVGAIANCPPLDGVTHLSLLAENDENGASERGCQQAGGVWRRAGRRVEFIRPDHGKDLNDELMLGRARA